MRTLNVPSKGVVNGMPAQAVRVRDWQLWSPYAAVAWSIIYAVLGIFWAVSGRGFPYTAETASDAMMPLLGRFGPGVAWIVVIIAGIPAVVLGTAMLRGVRGRVLRPFLITVGILLTGALLLLMTGLNLLVNLGYTPFGIVSLFIGDKFGQVYLGKITQWPTLHQLVCLAGGFLWLAAVVSYARRSGDACLYCGRQDRPERWRGANQAARWGRIAVYVAMIVPIFYALTRYAWALGFPLGMDEARFRSGQATGIWIFGALSHGNFMLFGALLMLGLVQRWGEVFPRWMIGLAGRRVPVALAIIPASLASVLLIVGGFGIWSGLDQMIANLATMGADGFEIVAAMVIEVGPTLLFPVWGIALAVATLGYYFRRRGPCAVCGRGASE